MEPQRAGKYRISSLLCARDPIYGSWRKQACTTSPAQHDATWTHLLPPQVPSPLSGGHMPGKAKVRRNHGLPRRAPKANPSINGADFAPSKDRALLIIQGTVQLCKSVDSLCLIAAFYRSGVGEDGDAQSPSCWVPEGKHPVHKRRNTPLGAGPTEGSAQSQAPPYL